MNTKAEKRSMVERLFAAYDAGKSLVLTSTDVTGLVHILQNMTRHIETMENFLKDLAAIGDDMMMEAIGLAQQVVEVGEARWHDDNQERALADLGQAFLDHWDVEPGEADAPEDLDGVEAEG